MTTNNWDGTVTKEMFDFSDEVSKEKDETFKKLAKNYVRNCLIGKSHLTGEGSLIEYHDEIEEELVEKGEIAILEYPDTKEKFLAIPRNKQEDAEEKPTKEKVKENLLKEPVNIEFQLLDNEKEVLAGSQVEKYVIFKANRDGLGLLEGIDYFLQKLTNIIRKMERDLFMSEKRLIFIISESPDEKDVKKWLKSWGEGVFPIISFDKSANPDKQAISEGKQGINPQQVKFQVYEPNTDERARHIRDYRFWWGEMEKAFGIRHDTLQEKEERAPVLEVGNSQAYFDAIERKGWRIRWKAIKEYNRVFDNGEGNYIFKYGKIGG